MSRPERASNSASHRGLSPPSNRRVRGVVAVAGGLLVLWMAWHVIEGREPSHEGRSLHSWLREFDNGALDANAPASRAIRAMSTNCIPFLVEDIVARDPVWRVRARTVPLFSKISWIRQSPAQTARSRASKALRLLGSDAGPALPLLIEEVRKAEGRTGIPWIGITAIVHSAPETIPTVIKELDSPPYRSQAAYFLGLCATNASATLPFLIRCSQDDEWQTRYHALQGLARFGPSAAPAEQVVRELVNDTNTFVAQQAAVTLESIILPSDRH